MIMNSINETRKSMHSQEPDVVDTRSKITDEDASVKQYASVLAYIDQADISNKVIPYAETLADSLHAGLLLVSVVEPDSQGYAPFDPVEWSLRRVEAKNNLDRLISEYRLDPVKTNITVLEGESAEAVVACLSSSQNNIAVFCRKNDGHSGHVGATYRALLERCAGSIFLVPSHVATSSRVRFQRFMVPLDGSTRAESILPTINSMAKSCDATVVLFRASPSTDIPELMRDDRKSAQLKAELEQHNQDVAKQYLERIRRRLRESGIKVEVRVLGSGDTRRQIVEAIAKESIDIVVLSSHGVSGHADVPLGDVANYVMSRSPVPTLMLRDMSLASSETVMNRLSEVGGRAPEGAD